MNLKKSDLANHLQGIIDTYVQDMIEIHKCYNRSDFNVEDARIYAENSVLKIIEEQMSDEYKPMNITPEEYE